MKGEPNTTGSISPGRRRGVLIGVVVALILGTAATLYMLAITHGERELSAALAEADRLDPGWRWRDLQAKRPQIPEHENGATRALQAIRLLPKTWPTWSDVVDAPPNVQFNQQQIDAIVGELKAAGAALHVVRQLADLPRGRFPHTEYGFTTTPSESFGIRSLFQLLVFDATIHSQRGDSALALRSCRALVNTLATLRDDPVLVAVMVRFAGRTMLCGVVERTLAQGQPAADELLLVQLAVEAEERSQADVLSLRATRAEFEDYFVLRAAGKLQELRPGVDPVAAVPWHQKWPGWLQAGRAQHLKWHNAQVEMAKKPLHLQDWSAAATQQLLGITTSGLVKILEANQRTCAQLRCLSAALAAERFRIAKGRWPTTLAELTPDFLTAVPLDPYDGKPLRLAVRSDGLVIYSLGPDKNDDAGKLRWGPDERQIGFDGLDLGTQLWDVAARRQPPPPEVLLKDFPGPLPPPNP